MIDVQAIEKMVAEYQRYNASTNPPIRVEATQEVMDELRRWFTDPASSVLGVPVVLNDALPPPGWWIVSPPPELLYDEDGVLIAVKGHGHSRYVMLREIADAAEWVLDDLKYLNDDDEYVLSLLAVRSLTQGFEDVWYRPTDPSLEADMDHGEYGMDTWWPCASDHPDAVAYTSTGLGG